MSLIAVTPFADIARSIPSLMMGSGFFAKTILFLLFVISVISWAIIWDRTRLYLRLRAKGTALRKVASSKGLVACMNDVKQFMPSVEASVLSEARRYIDVRTGGAERIAVSSPGDEENERGKMRETLDRRATVEIAEMERHLIFLSTTASVAPFLGLLGTVWGIMSSFLSMGVQGTASIEVVGPGIAEALVTTIAGLATAIPALVGYNVLVRNVHRKETRVELLISRVIEHFVGSSVDHSAAGAGRRHDHTEASV